MNATNATKILIKKDGGYSITGDCTVCGATEGRMYSADFQLACGGYYRGEACNACYKKGPYSVAELAAGKGELKGLPEHWHVEGNGKAYRLERFAKSDAEDVLQKRVEMVRVLEQPVLHAILRMPEGTIRYFKCAGNAEALGPAEAGAEVA